MTAPRLNKPTSVKPLRILVADDDYDTVITLSTLLKQEGHQVIEVYQGDAVVDLVRRYEPDVVLLDIGMPKVTGFQIARQLREELRTACPLLVAITAWRQEKAKEIGKLSGFHHYMTKPYTLEDLLDILRPLAVSGPQL